MIITVTFNPAIDKTAEVEKVCVGGLNRLKNVEMDAGGKGVNVSKTIQAFGGKSICTGFLAGSAGDFIEHALETLQISHDFVRVAGNTRTNLKVLDQHMELTELNEAGPDISEANLMTLKKRILALCKPGDIVVLSGNVSPGVPVTIYEELIQAIHASDGRVVLDADGALFKHGIKAHPDCIKPNKYELAMHFGLEETMDTATLIEKASTLLQGNTNLVVVSMGKEGSIFITKEAVYIIDALHVHAHSSVGAGDAMVAGITYALDHQMNIEETIRIAVAAGTGAVMTKGTKPASKEVVDALMQDVHIRKWEA